MTKTQGGRDGKRFRSSGTLDEPTDSCRLGVRQVREGFGKSLSQTLPCQPLVGLQPGEHLENRRLEVCGCHLHERAHNTTTRHTRATKLGEQAGGLQITATDAVGCDNAGWLCQAARRSSGSAAAEHLTNPAEGKRPREMPTESRQSIKTMDLHLSYRFFRRSYSV